MADQGIWFKLHTSALDDPDLDNLSMADFGRWAKLATYTKRQGTAGCLALQSPARALCSMLQVKDFSDLITCIKRLPHVRVEEMHNSTVSLETNASVSFDNWLKYQGDFSTHRVKRFREMKRSKRRGEENRREQKRTDKNIPPTTTELPPLESVSSNGQDPFRIPASILKALDACAVLGQVGPLRRPGFWRAQIRAHDIDFEPELLKAEAWLVSNPGRAPRRDMGRFLANWFTRVGERA